MKEVWKTIEGFNSYYQVSSLSRVRSIDRKIACRNGVIMPIKGRILKQYLNLNIGKGYWTVTFCIKNKNHLLFVHRLIATAFIKNKNNKPEVNHIDGNSHNNKIDNLEWATRKENAQHAHAIGLFPKSNFGKGVKSYQAKLTEKDIISIRNRHLLGETCLSISNDYPVCKSSIVQICARKTWQHVTSEYMERVDRHCAERGLVLPPPEYK